MNRQEKITKTTGQILRENICTLFNLLNLLIAVALVYVHAWSNLFFIFVIAFNTIIGIAQEIKAKRLIEKLSLLSAPKTSCCWTAVSRFAPMPQWWRARWRLTSPS